MRLLRLAVVALVLVAGSQPAAQDDVFFQALAPEVLPQDVGATAFAVIGSFREGRALTWTPTSGVRDLGGRSGTAISLDGRTIVGRALDARGAENAAIWRGGTDWRLLGSVHPNAQPCDNLLSGSLGASDDGKVIVGLAWDGCRFAHAFRWEESTGMVDLGTSNDRSTRADAVSGDGRVVVGWQETPVGFRQGAKWIDRRQELIVNAAGRIAGEANATNRDGSIIVGQFCDAANPNPASLDTSAAWKWTTSGGMRCFPMQRPPRLPNLPYQTAMLATSDNGHVVGGSFTFGLDAEALIWIGDQGYFLQDYLADHGLPDAFRGWINTGFITGVSPDGRTLVGFGAGRTNFQGYIVILPEKTTR